MAKDLPYFKFFCSEWSDGDITLENFETQGLFINICAYYWSNECVISLEKAKKKFKHCNEICFDNLINSGIIKIIEGNLSINFLNEQQNERSFKSLTNSENGKKGGRPKKQNETEQKPNALISLSEPKANQKAIREEKRREEKIIKENIINNTVFVSECKTSTQWLEVTAMQNKINVDIVKVFIDTFESHLIQMQEQKKTVKEYKEHFTHWFKKQDLSSFRIKSFGKTNQI